VETRPYSELTVGVPTEVLPGERRVAMTPQNVALLLKKGFKRVLIEHGAGYEAQFPVHAYEAAGATMANSRNVWTESDIVLKVRPPRLATSSPASLNDAPRLTSDSNSFVDGFRPGSTIISLMYPNQERSKPLVETLESKGVSSFAMDMIPRISRAQTFDVLSSMANIAGYKAVLEASNHFGRFMTGQTTAAGKIPPCKVLVIGAGVAGLSAIATVSRSPTYLIPVLELTFAPPRHAAWVLSYGASTPVLRLVSRCNR
jgi:NAD(P) transhydrogenase